MRFKDQTKEVIEECSVPWFWTLLFGCFYFAFKNNWKHTFISLGAGLLTGGISWFIYPFFSNTIIRNQYISKGWKEI